MKTSYDVTIVGAGIVGLATAMRLVTQKPELRVAVLEKEPGVALHQTGHNSGVIHSGIYYRPGSLKARLCVSGARQLVAFCEERGVPYELCGKVVVATSEDEIPALRELHRRGTANGVPGMRMLGPAEVRDLEPHVSCVLGMQVPTTGIVDFGPVAQAYRGVFEELGGTVVVGRRLVGVREDASGLSLILRPSGCEGSNTPLSPPSRGESKERCSSQRKADEALVNADEIIESRGLINCGGLHSDRIARMAGLDPGCRIVPFRGEYYQIRPSRGGLVKNLIYPVPDPRFPFLGVHFTRMIDGKVEAGPNAVLAYAREGYSKATVSVTDLLEIFKYPGFWRLALKYWKPGFHEMARSYSKRLFVRALQRLIPEIRESDLVPGGAGVRAQALATDGRLLDDFHILRHRRMMHVLNAPSPAATSSLAIADHILQAAAHLLS
jgi:(S)-2-hydroxyglutarate dehydrogenase